MSINIVPSQGRDPSAPSPEAIKNAARILNQIAANIAERKRKATLTESHS